MIPSYVALHRGNNESFKLEKPLAPLQKSCIPLSAEQYGTRAAEVVIVSSGPWYFGRTVQKQGVGGVKVLVDKSLDKFSY